MTDLIKRDDALKLVRERLDLAVNCDLPQARPREWEAEHILFAIRALPATDPAAIREAALREVLALRRLGQTCFDNIEVMKDGWLIHEDDVKALTGEKK